MLKPNVVGHNPNSQRFYYVYISILITQVNALNILGKYSHLWSNKLFGGIKAFPVDWFIVSLGKHYVNFRIIIYVILCSTLQFVFFFFFLIL